MFLKYFDFISPPITLFYRREERHINWISGVISIITYSFILMSTIYYSLDFFERNINKFYFYNKSVEDAGIFPLNQTSMHHYVTIGKASVDFRAVSLIGVNKYITGYMNNNDISKIDHWIYGPCDLKDIAGMEEYVENKTSFMEAACVKKMWNVTEQRYYTSNDIDKFNYPQLEHGASNPNTKNYGVIIEKCRNETKKLNNDIPCYENETINKYMLKAVSLALYVIDHSIIVNNYSQPLKTFFYKVTNGMLGSSFTSNQLNFDPVEIRSHNGIMFDHTDVVHTYIYNQNAKTTLDGKDTGILCCFYFWMQNRLQLYERYYLKIQESLAGLGGMSKMIFTISGVVNYLVNQFYILQDSIELSNRYVKKYDSFPQSRHKINTSTQSLMVDNQVNNDIQHSNIVRMNQDDNKLTIKCKEKKDAIKLSILKTKEPTSKSRIKKKLEYLEYSFVDFLMYLCYRCCRKFRNESKAIGRMERLRTNILSEEFLYDLYIFFEQYQIQLKKTEINIPINESKNSLLGLIKV